MNARVGAIGVVVAVLAIGLLSIGALNKAEAASSVTAVGSPYNLGQTGNFQICVDTNTTLDKAVLYDPDSMLVWQTQPGWTKFIAANTCDTIDPGSETPAFGGFNKVGTWVFAANTAGGNPFIFEFAVTFQVVPESVIGALAVVLPSIGAFAGYKVLRSRSK
jgi:hypothetical protein